MLRQIHSASVTNSLPNDLIMRCYDDLLIGNMNNILAIFQNYSTLSAPLINPPNFTISDHKIAESVLIPSSKPTYIIHPQNQLKINSQFAAKASSKNNIPPKQISKNAQPMNGNSTISNKEKMPIAIPSAINQSNAPKSCLYKESNQESLIANKSIIQKAYAQAKEEIKSEENATKVLIERISMEEDKERNEKEPQAKCPICLSEIEFKDYLPIDKCGHLFHKECMANYLKSCLESNHLPAKCPYEKCNGEIISSDLSLFLDKDTKAIIEQRAFKNLIDTNPNEYSCCPTANCQYIFLYTLGVDIPRLICPICNMDYCLNCKCLYHNWMTCNEYKISNTYSDDDNKFEEFVKGQKFKQCPKCRFWVEKTQGCNHMTCRCGMQFCYVCGGNYPNCNCIRNNGFIFQNN